MSCYNLSKVTLNALYLSKIKGDKRVIGNNTYLPRKLYTEIETKQNTKIEGR